MARPPLEAMLEKELLRRCGAPVPYAELWRKIGEAAARLGLQQPSYGWVRERARLERARRDAARARREFWTEVAGDFAAGLVKRPGLRVLEHMEKNDGA